MADLEQLYSALRQADAAGNTEDATKLANYIRQQQAPQPDSLGRYKATPESQQKLPEEIGIFEGAGAALKRGVESFSDIGAGYGVAKSSLFGTEKETRKKMEAAKQEAAKPETAPGMTVADFERIAKEKGFIAAVAEAPKYIVEQVLQSAPQMAGPLVAGAAASPFLTPVGGALVGMGAYGLQQFGNFVLRQAQEKDDPKELEIAKAALTAGGTAPIGYFADRFTVGLGGSGKKVGEEILKELTARQVASKVGAGAAKGATKGVIAEAPTEVLEQAAERWQAGLSLTNSEAMKEYKEAFFGAAAAGGGIGGVSGGAKEYVSRPRPDIGTSEPSVSGDRTEGETLGGTGRLDKEGLALLSERLGALDGRERAIDNQLKQVQPYIRDIEAVDPNDPRIAEAIDTAKQLNDELKVVQEEKKTIVETLQTVGKEKAFNAPQQMGLDLGAPVEQQAAIPAAKQEFDLTAPEGATGVTTKAEPIKIPEYPTSKMMLVNTGVNPVKGLVSFFKTIKPAAVSENEVNAHNAEINKVIEEVDDFQKEAKGLDRTKRLTFLRDFIDKFSTAPEDKQSQMSKLPAVLAGMDVEGQQTLLSDISQFPKLNTVRGMKEFRGQLQEAMLDYTEAKLGRSRESAILPWQTHEDVNTQKDASELQRLGNIAEKYMTPEEKAAKNYLTAHAPAGEPFGSALRSAAFDLGAEQGPVFPGQTKETAQLFRNWVAKNMHPSTLARFDATVNEFRQMGEKISKRSAEEAASEGKGVIGGKATGKAKGAGFGRMMHPSVETRIANNDLQGALRALSKVGNNWQKELSKKLMSLNLATTIGYDQQEAFAQRLVDQNAASARAQIVSKLQTEFPSVAKRFARTDDIREMYKAFTELKNGKLDVPKETVDASIGQIEIVREAYEAAVAVLGASGTYLTHADTLSLNRDRGGNNPNTFLHEVLHAATHWALDPTNYGKLSTEQKQAVAELERTYKIAKELYGTGNEISSIDEFVVEAFTNPEFQKFLKDIPMPNQKKTLWNKFTDFIKDMFGMGNVLGYTLANANALLQAPSNLSPEAKALNQQGKLGGYILDDTFKAGPFARSFINNVFAGKVEWSDVKDNMPTFLENAKDSTRKHLLGALTLRQLADLVGPRIPAFKSFINNMEAMLDERNAMLNKTRDIVKPWMAFQSKNKAKAETLNKLMLDATRLGIDPDTNTSDKRLNQAWNDIGETGQNIYRDVRNFYKNQLDAHIQVLLDRKVAALEAKGLSKAEAIASQEYKDLDAHFRENTIEPYFPIRRFGQYWLQVGKGKSKEFYMFESAGERNKFQKQREKQLSDRGESKEVSSGNSIKNLINNNIQDFEFLSKLKTLIQTETGNTRQELKNNITDAVEQMYLQTLPDQNIRKMFMNREGIQGMNQDMLRAFTASAFRIAYQQSRLAHSDKLYRDIDGAEKRLDGMPANEKKVYGDYIGELENRLQYIMNPPDTGKIPSFLSNMSFIWYMTSPASALVNMLGVPSVGIPVVGAKFGNTVAAKTMINYARKFATTGFVKDGKPAFPSFANKPGIFNAKQQEAFDKFVADGLIDITLTHDIVGLAETDSNLYTGRMQKVMQVLSATFHGAEKFNREVVAMSAYDLSYAKNIKPESQGGLGLSPDAAQKRAIEEAKDLTYKSMFDYSALNKPRYFQGKYAKVFLQFKQFSQQMTYMLARSAYEGFSKKFDANDRKDIGGQINNTRIEDGQEALDGADLNEAIDKYIKEFRSEGRNRLMGTLGTTFIFAGATGLPGWAAFSALMEMMHYIFADEDEEDKPFDFDNWFKNWSADTFGGFVGDSISRGVASQATGVDLADRMSLNGMWFRDQRKQPDMESAAQAYLVSLMGPAVGIGINAFNAYDQFSQGHIGRAIETASPALIKNGLKAARFEREGALTLSGDELIPDFSSTEIAAQAIGFQPERLAQKQKANIETKNMEQEIIKKHDMLLSAFFMAIDTQDSNLQDRVLEKIARFNSANPGKAIYPDTLLDSVERRYKQRAGASITGGVKIDRNLIGQLGEMNKYGNVD